MKRNYLAAIALCLTAAPALAQEKYIGEIFAAGFNFCPRGTAALNGQLLSIAENTALFSLLGTTYGGDGRTSFALPDLRSRVPMHQGQGPGLSNRAMGERSGAETTTLAAGNLPPHNHGVTVTINGTNTPAAAPTPQGGLNALSTTGNLYATGDAVAMAGTAASVTQNDVGGGQPVNNMQPGLTMNYCIVQFGIFPSRN